MGYLYLSLLILCGAGYSVFSKIFTKNTEGSKNIEFIFNTILSFSSMLGWMILFIIEGSFNASTLWYSLGFALCYAGFFVFFQLAIKSGNMSITTLLVQMSLVLVGIYSFIFWGASVTAYSVSGIILVAISIFLCVFDFKKGKEKTKFNFKWLIYSLLTMLCNAGCSIFQKTELLQFDNYFGGQTIFFAMAMVFLMNGIISLLIKKKVVAVNLKRNIWIPLLAGILNFLTNLFVLLLAKTDLSPSLIYPSISVGVLILCSLYSLIFLKEKLTIPQWIGMLIGAAAVVLLSI